MPSSSKPKLQKPSSAAGPFPTTVANSRAPITVWMVAAVCLIAPLLAGIPDAGAVVKDSGSPDTRIWTPLICALSLIAATIACYKTPPDNDVPTSKNALLGFIGLFTFTILLFLLHWAHGSHFTSVNVDPMLYGTCYWCGLAALGYACTRLGSMSMRWAELIVLAIVAASGIEAAYGVNHYIYQLKINHSTDWREFGTSSPDYLAGYLVVSIPITVAAFLTAKTDDSKLISWLIALVLLLQIALVPLTGSRTAIISLAIGTIFLAFGLWFTVKKGLSLPATTLSKVRFLAGIAILALVIGSGPILHRLSAHARADQAHSFEFRKYTWHGAWNLATHKPLGVGPGMFVDYYPRYEIIAFTRVAHSGYLQFLDEFGFFGLAVLIAAIVSVLALGLTTLANPSASNTDSDDSERSFVRPVLTSGLIAGVVAALVQNFLDSDFQITLDGVIFFVALGLMGGLAKSASDIKTQDSRSWISKGLIAASGTLAVVSLWYCAVGIAEVSSVSTASKLNPLSGDLLSEVAWQNFAASTKQPETVGQGAADAIPMLNQAASLEPTSLDYRRLMDIDMMTSQYKDAIYAAQRGLGLDPQALDLWIGEARAYENCKETCSNGSPDEQIASERAAAHDAYLKVYNLEHSPYGQIRAIPELVEYRFAIADAALGHDAIDQGDAQTAVKYLEDAKLILYSYLGEDRTMFSASQGTNSVALNSDLEEVYESVMDDEAKAYAQLGQTDQVAKLVITKPAILQEFEQLNQQKPPAQ